MEQPLPPFGSCNLGSLDLSKFVGVNGEIDYSLLEKAVRLSVNFLDSVIDVNAFPLPEIEAVSKASRQIGLGVMGVADLFMAMKVAYGSTQSLELLDGILRFINETATDESIKMGERFGVPEWCQKLPVPRRNITRITFAPTGTIAIIADCNSGIEPFFSELTERTDKTGTYTIASPSQESHFRCAVSATGEKEVTWEEHINMQAVAQKYSDSGVSKTINFPKLTHRDTIAKAFLKAWSMGCKGITVYRNGSREVEVLSPKNLAKDKCPVCGEDTIKYDGCTKCTKCDWSICTVG